MGWGMGYRAASVVMSHGTDPLSSVGISKKTCDLPAGGEAAGILAQWFICKEALEEKMPTANISSRGESETTSTGWSAQLITSRWAKGHSRDLGPGADAVARPLADDTLGMTDQPWGTGQRRDGGEAGGPDLAGSAASPMADLQAFRTVCVVCNEGRRSGNGQVLEMGVSGHTMAMPGRRAAKHTPQGQPMCKVWGICLGNVHSKHARRQARRWSSRGSDESGCWSPLTMLYKMPLVSAICQRGDLVCEVGQRLIRTHPPEPPPRCDPDLCQGWMCRFDAAIEDEDAPVGHTLILLRRCTGSQQRVGTLVRLEGSVLGSVAGGVGPMGGTEGVRDG
eukprot:GGOE01027411.1.p1 GENE.GGOE01027411.1~~GGOE01027411.1.p1  ORF type:complete len:336 (+),score=-7.86 GGOE01027411.1:214-1221(+)